MQIAGGLIYDRGFPYKPQKTSCAYRQLYPVGLTGVYSVTSEQSMIDHVLNVGPIVVGINTEGWDGYKTGIFNGCFYWSGGLGIGRRRRVYVTENDHEVQIVGVDTEGGYWIIRNSWGTEWGRNGYMLLKLVCITITLSA